MHVHIVVVVVVVGTFALPDRLQASSVQKELLILTIMACVEIDIVIAEVVIQALIAIARLDTTCQSWTGWPAPKIEVLIVSTVASMHVDVTIAKIIIQALIRGSPCSQRFPIEVPLLIGTIVATVHIHVAIAVHVQTVVVLFGFQCFAFQKPLLVRPRMTVMHVDVLIIEIVVHALVIVPRLEMCYDVGLFLKQRQRIGRIERQRHPERTRSEKCEHSWAPREESDAVGTVSARSTLKPELERQWLEPK